MMKYSVPEMKLYEFEPVAAAADNVQPSDMRLMNNAAGNLGNEAVGGNVINAAAARKVRIDNILGFNN